MIRLLEVTILLLVTWPAARVCFSPAFWKTFPRIATPLTGLLGLYCSAVALVASSLPAALGPLAVVAGLVGLYLLWRARPSYGRSRGLPPGSLAHLPLASWTDHLFFQKQAQRHGPIFKTAQFLRPMVCILGLDRGHELIRRHDSRLLSPPLPLSRYIPAGFLRHMQLADHGRYRALFISVFKPEVHRRLEPFTREAFAEGLAVMLRECEQAPGRGVRTRPHLNRMYFIVWMRLFFDIGPEDEAFSRLKRFYITLDMRNPLWASDRKRRDAVHEASGILHTLAERPASNCFLGEMIRVNPGAIDDETAMRNLLFIFHTSWSDLIALTQWVWKMLADHPEWNDRLRRETDPASTLATRIVRETLRLEQSEHIYRTTLEPVEFEGFVIPAGWLVRVLVRESHRMPESFEDPETFDPDRFDGPEPDRSIYSPFGAFRHACIGVDLTLDMATIFLQELARGFDWTVAVDGPREFSRYRHWAPNSRTRIELRARDH